jgi:lipoate-protein ligase A
MNEVWRLIDSGNCPASYNMALDETLALSVRKGASPPALRLYGWEGPSVSLGRFQKVADIDIDYCRSRTIPVVRRPTGGRAVIHDAELTYGLAVRTDRPPFSKGLLESYKSIGSAFTLAFRRIGLKAETRERRERGTVLAGSPLCFQSSSYGEILVNDKKIVGAAQKRWPDGLLQQGSVPYNYDEEMMKRIFRVSEDIGLDRCMTGIKDLMPDLDEDSFRDSLAGAFEDIFSIRLVSSRPSEEELALAARLQEEKYLLDSWNLRL